MCPLLRPQVDDAIAIHSRDPYRSCLASHCSVQIANLGKEYFAEQLEARSTPSAPCPVWTVWRLHRECASPPRSTARDRRATHIEDDCAICLQEVPSPPHRGALLQARSALRRRMAHKQPRPQIGRESAAARTACGHEFHSTCLVKALAKSVCPDASPPPSARGCPRAPRAGSARGPVLSAGKRWGARHRPAPQGTPSASSPSSASGASPRSLPPPPPAAARTRARARARARARGPPRPPHAPCETTQMAPMPLRPPPASTPPRAPWAACSTRSRAPRPNHCAAPEPLRCARTLALRPNPCAAPETNPRAPRRAPGDAQDDSNGSNAR
jgi:hypothetical protein